MIINKIEIQNFLSIGELTLDFSKFSGITEIEGKNFDYTEIKKSNGAGKSAIAESIIFALTGKTLRKTINANISRFNTGGCNVKIHLNNDEVIIERSLNPTKIKLKINGQLVERESVLETQKLIEKTLNFNYVNLVTSLIFGQQNNISFFSSNPEEKRQLIQTYLNLDDIFALRDKTIELKSTYLNLVRESKIKIDVYNRELHRLRERKGYLLESNNEAQKLLHNKKIVAYLESNSIDEIKRNEEVKQSLQEKCVTLQSEINSLVETNNFLDRQIKNFSDIKCKNCGFLDEALELKTKEFSEKKTSAQDEISSKRKVLSNLISEFDKIDIAVSDADLEILKSITEFNVEQPNLEKDIVYFSGLLDNELKQATQYEEDYQISKFWERAFSEKGLIKYIIRNILDYINSKLDYYLTFITSNVYSVRLLETLDFVVYKGQQAVPFETLSGGEKKSLDLSLCLALNDLVGLVNNITTNIIFFDEAVESLDPMGIQGFYNLLKEIQEKKKIFIITHDSYFHSLLSEESKLVLEKRDGVTAISSTIIK